MEPFWPRKSSHFLACRRAVRPVHTNPDLPAAIGLSGGPDSLALVAAAAAEGKHVRAVVVDHGLQPGSADVAARAAEQAQRLDVPAEVVRVDVDTVAGTGRAIGLEAAARAARYSALFAAAGSDADVWVAHTADDQAETLLLGALRGNPAGMAPRSDRLVRPLLFLRRAETVGACQELGLETWDDPMNHDSAYRRVAIRQQIIPALTELLGGDAVVPLAGTANRIAEDRQLLESLADLKPTADCAELAADPAPVRRRRIAAWLIGNGIPVQGDQLNAIERLVTDWHGQGPITLTGGRTVTRDAGHLHLV